MTASMTYVLVLRKLFLAAASAFQTFSRKIAGVLPAGSVGVKKRFTTTKLTVKRGRRRIKLVK
jgi:hypothetical protein